MGEAREDALGKRSQPSLGKGSSPKGAAHLNDSPVTSKCGVIRYSCAHLWWLLGSWEKRATFPKDWGQHRKTYIGCWLVQWHSDASQPSQPLPCSQVALYPVSRITAGGKKVGWPRAVLGWGACGARPCHPGSSCTTALTVLSHLLSSVECKLSEEKEGAYLVPQCILCIKFCPYCSKSSINIGCLNE